MSDEPRSVVVLGVLHDLRGPGFQGYVDDPSYRLLVERTIRKVDYLFEEASGMKPSIARDLSDSPIGKTPYLVIDPGRTERPLHGIPEEVASSEPIDLYDSSDSKAVMPLRLQRMREELWIRRMEPCEFKRALVIVGIAHSLSFAFRLSEAGFFVESVWGYTPHHKLCRREHA
jgi:hypothetical protein